MSKNKLLKTLLLMLFALLFVVGCSSDPEEGAMAEDGEMDHSEMDMDDEEMDHSNMDMEDGEMDHSGMDMDDEVPADLDTSTERKTDNGHFVVSISSENDAMINEIHSWTLHIETSDGTPVEDAVVTVGGGMPQHGHGLPTQPEVTENLGGGDYLVEGVKFQMMGWWELSFDITAGDMEDSITFNLVLDEASNIWAIL